MEVHEMLAQVASKQEEFFSSFLADVVGTEPVAPSTDISLDCMLKCPITLSDMASRILQAEKNPAMTGPMPCNTTGKSERIMSLQFVCVHLFEGCPRLTLLQEEVPSC